MKVKQDERREIEPEVIACDEEVLITSANRGRAPGVVVNGHSLEPSQDGVTFLIKDSGRRTAFASGMVRDVADDKVDWELIFNGPMAQRWAEHLTKGNRKYPDPEPGKANWMRAAGPEEFVRFRKSAVRHFAQWLRGDRDEDHVAAILFNLNGYEYVREQLTRERRLVKKTAMADEREEETRL